MQGNPGEESIQLEWLVRTRWAALGSLAAILGAARFFLSLDLPLFDLVWVLAIGALSNLVVPALRETVPTRFLAAGALLLDVLLLSLMLFFCGGYANPLSILFLAYVALAAVVLDARWTWIIFGASVVCFCALFYVYIPLPQLGLHVHPAPESGFSLHLYGMLLAFCLMGAIVSFFVTRMRRELIERECLISGLQREQEDRRRLLSLATLAGGVAHELATPIGTLSLIGDDLVKAFEDDDQWGEDVRVLRQELDRCAAILQRIRQSNAELPGEVPQTFHLTQVIDTVRQELSASELKIVSFDTTNAQQVALHSLRHALGASLLALIRNALQASPSNASVMVRACVVDDDVEFIIEDAGSGMSDEVRARAGEPFFTSKAPGEGMGLGLYLTRLFALQVGGSLRITSTLGIGTEVSLKIPRTMRM